MVNGDTASCLRGYSGLVEHLRGSPKQESIGTAAARGDLFVERVLHQWRLQRRCRRVEARIDGVGRDVRWKGGDTSEVFRLK